MFRPDPRPDTYFCAADVNGVTEMQFSTNGTAWTAWETFAATKPITLPTGAGTKRVYVHFKDAAAKISPAYSDTITLAP